MDRSILDMVDELKSWELTGGAEGHITLKRDNDNAVKVSKDAAWKLFGGRVIRETERTEKALQME